MKRGVSRAAEETVLAAGFILNWCKPVSFFRKQAFLFFKNLKKGVAHEIQAIRFLQDIRSEKDLFGPFVSGIVSCIRVGTKLVPDGQHLGYADDECHC
jgi:hypothetical protein